MEFEPQRHDSDITETISNEIRLESYTCLVCTCEITPQDSLWSCSPCHRVYHLDCISHWSVKGSSTDDKGNWNCPSCNNVHRKTKFQFKCWCGKSLNPAVDKLNPGSCGQTCGAKLKGCVHRCTLPCHPGPHASCNSLGPVMKCHCGAHETQWPCVMTPYKKGWHCKDSCDALLPCEIHKCSKVCHDGLCGKCQTFVESTCYCGENTDMIKCHLQKPISCKSTDRSWVGSFKCSKKKEILYDCNLHDELIPCQKPSLSIKHCPLSPDRINNCHCGKTSLASLGIERTSCTDPIPTCEQQCGKKLACGHNCQSMCHDGSCGPCFQIVETKCQCQLHNYTVPCKFNQKKMVPKCTDKCFALLSCRRHHCEETCCKYFKAAQRRERERKKALKNTTIPDENTIDINFQLNTTFDIEPAHICLKNCGKILRCGNPEHRCQQTCHTGPCPTCLESTNEDLVCHCGDTVVHAPVRCGTILPECHSQCRRPQICGHEPMPHNCHEDSVPCAKCTRPVKKLCNCGKKVVDAMCFQTDVFCYQRCGKQLRCLHTCSRNCHAGKCEDVKCPEICGKKRQYCSHVDTSICHFPARCNVPKNCETLVKITCKCGRLTKNVPCGANAEASSCEGSALNCETACILKQRDEQLKEAFGITSSSTTKINKLSDIKYDIENIIKVAIKQPKWCLSIEKIYLDFMSNPSIKRYDFKPMVSEKRRFLHYLAEVYDISAEAQDPEPHRSITLRKTVLSKTPSQSLSEAIKGYQSLRKSASPMRVATPRREVVATVKYNAILIEECIEGVEVNDLAEAVDYLIDSKSQYNGLHNLRFIEITNSEVKRIEDGKFLVFVKGNTNTGTLSSVVEKEFHQLVPYLKEQLVSNHLAKQCRLVLVNEFLKVLDENKVIANSEITDTVLSLNRGTTDKSKTCLAIS